MKYVKKTNQIQALRITDKVTIADIRAIFGDTLFDIVSHGSHWWLMVDNGAIEPSDWVVKEGDSVRAYSDEQFHARYEAQE